MRERGTGGDTCGHHWIERCSATEPHQARPWFGRSWCSSRAAERGFDDDDELNAYGTKLEALIDALGLDSDEERR
jgi:hypothetical protein